VFQLVLTANGYFQKDYRTTFALQKDPVSFISFNLA
jgi:hypothetical protein